MNLFYTYKYKQINRAKISSHPPSSSNNLIALVKKTGHGLLFYEGFSVFCFPRETLSSFCRFLIHINWRFQMNLTVARLLWDVLSKLICSFLHGSFWGKNGTCKNKNIQEWKIYIKVDIPRFCYVCLKTEICCLKTFVKIRVGEKVYWNA